MDRSLPANPAFALQVPSTTTTTTTTTTTSSSSSSLFSRRPSFFGGRSRRAPSPKPPSSADSSTNPITNTIANTNTNTNTNTTASNSTSNTNTTASNSNTTNTPRQSHDSSAPSTPPRRRHGSRHSIASSVTDLGAQLRRSRSVSIRTSTSLSSHKRATSSTLALAYSPEKAPAPAAIATATAAPPRPALSVSTFTRTKPKSADNVKLDGPANAAPTPHVYEKSPSSAVDKPKTPFSNMAAPMPLRHPPSQKEMQASRAQAPTPQIPVPNGSTPNLIFQHIHDLASKRISTLDYLRKAHEGRIYWFNTLLFAKSDLSRLPSFSQRNQARRATHYLLLGFSLPNILDLNANSPADYLKALNALLLEFEQYQSIHPADGSVPSSLSRARIPHMFKRANLNMSSKARRSSSTAGDFPLLTHTNPFNSPDQGPTDSPLDADLLLPNESYTHLQTPSLPFDPDFFNTFATLCDVLIDCYTKIMSMLSTPESVAAAGGGVPAIIGDLFNKADARVRKIILAGVVREFEDSCRAGLKSEVGGVGKVVLGGLM